jgi:F0F1-type ATP synthase assembly protein I
LINAELGLADQSKTVVRVQLAVTALIALLFITQGFWAAASALYGGLISVASALLLGWGVARATELAKLDPRKSMFTLYVGAVQRFAGVLVLLALGMAVMKMVPLALLVGFGGAQLSFLFASSTNTKKNSKN